MFTDAEKDLMRDIGLNLDFDNLSDDDWVRIEDEVGDELTLHCLDENYNPNDRGKICEEILSKVSQA